MNSNKNENDNPSPRELVVDSVKVVLTCWPKSWEQVVGSAVICGAIVGAFYIVLVKTDLQKFRDLTSLATYLVAPGSSAAPTFDTYRLSFWTPGPDTLREIESANNGAVPDDYKWQNGELARLDEFETLLFGSSSLKLTGYRRVRVEGRGTSGDRKSGYWWTLTVAKDSSVDALITLYRDFWKPKSSFFIEESDKQYYSQP